MMAPPCGTGRGYELDSGINELELSTEAAAESLLHANSEAKSKQRCL